MAEQRDLLGRNRQSTGKTIEAGKPIPAGYYCCVVIIFIQNSRGDLLIQKRAKDTKFGGMYASTGGHPKAGQTYLIPPCTVYAAGPGLKILEVSEASELALRVYDPGHDDELEEAFDFIDFRPWKEPEVVPGTKGFGAETLAVQEQFRVVKLQLAEPLRISSEGQDRYSIYHCLQGTASVQLRDENRPAETVMVQAGQTVLVPAEVDEFYLVPEAPGTVLLEIQ